MTTKGRLLRGSSPQLGQHRPIRGGASNLAESGRQGSLVLASLAPKKACIESSGVGGNLTKHKCISVSVR